MLIYQDGRFYFGEASFVLPNGVAIDTENEESLISGFFLYALDKSFEGMIRCMDTDLKAYDMLSGLMNGDAYKQIGKLEPLICGGLKGYKCVYEDSRTQNEEYAFDVENGGKYRLLNVYVSVEKTSKSYDEAYKNRVINEILSGISAYKK